MEPTGIKKTQGTNPKRNKNPSAGQGPPAKPGFESQDHPSQNETNPVHVRHCTAEITAAMQSLKSQEKTQELSFGGEHEIQGQQNGVGAPQQNP